MRDEPIVSIILPVYNVGTCLRKTLDSLIDQSYSTLEIICIDDGSSDDSLSILKEYAAIDSRIRLYNQQNMGQGAARNRGMELASGDFILLLDADDIYDVNFVYKMAQRMMATEADVVVCRSEELDDATGTIRSAFWTVKADQLPTQDPFNVTNMYDFIFTAFIGWPWDKMFRKAFIDEYHLRFPDLENSEDLFFVFSALVYARRISFLDEILIKHRIGRSGSVSNSRTHAPMAFYNAIFLFKKELQNNPRLYEKLSWGFLNWAFNYTIWNIESMPDKEIRHSMLEEVMENHCPELEIFEHSKLFFGLEKNDNNRFNALFVQNGLEGMWNINGPAHPLLGYVLAFFNEAYLFGFKKAFGKVFTRFTKKNSKKTQKRGELLYEKEQKIEHGRRFNLLND